MKLERVKVVFSWDKKDEMKINIIQFLPYYPPHKWWLETHSQEWAENWTKKWYWKIINITTNIWTEFEWKDKIIKKENNKIITYYLPSIEIIWNFPIYKIWNKEVRNFFKSLSKGIKQENYFIITRTRFFITSLIWWFFAKKNKLKWYHIEHWSDYVKLSSKIKTFIAWFYDKTIWKWILKKSNLVIPISNACKRFVEDLWWKKVKLWPVIYRWFDFVNLVKENKLNTNDKDYKTIKEFKQNWKIVLGFVGRIYKWKWVMGIIHWINILKTAEQDIFKNIKLVIVWDGEDLENIKKIVEIEWLSESVIFTWWKDFKSALAIQSLFDIHIHSSLPWWWLSWTLVQGMYLCPTIVSSLNEWAKEIIWENKWKAILIWNQENYKILDTKKAILEWIETFKQWKDFRKINSPFIEKTFDWDKNIEKYYLEFKKQLMKNKKIIFVLPKTKWWAYYVYNTITNILKNKWYNVIVENTIKWWLLSHFWNRNNIIFSVIPFLFKPSKQYNYLLVWNYLKEKQKNRLWNKLLYLTPYNINFANNFILMNKYLLDIIPELKKFNKKTKIIPNFIDFKEFENIRNQNLSKDLSFENKKEIKFLTITWFKFFDKWKWILNLQKVLINLSNIYNNKTIIWNIWWNSDNEIFKKIKNEFDKLEIPNNLKINWLWWINKDELLNQYKQNDLFLYWTELDVFPTVLLEAWASGLPLLVNNFQSFNEIIPLNDICKTENEMLDKIQNIDLKENQKMNIENAKKYDINKIIKQFIDLIE